MSEYRQKYQNSKQAEAMNKMRSDLDETKTIMHNGIDAVHRRGGELDDLVGKSERLNAETNAQFKTVTRPRTTHERKTECECCKCCVIL